MATSASISVSVSVLFSFLPRGPAVHLVGRGVQEPALSVDELNVFEPEYISVHDQSVGPGLGHDFEEEQLE